ncbi:MAG: hypothetical protein H0X14_04840 [Acidobacteria bacterium]|nr:hypothetical protein [Acidobacteriota bacterium]
MSHVVVIDNQEIPLDAETAASDHEIRQALKWCYPEISNATINRRTEGEREIITVIKRAGTKGVADWRGTARECWGEGSTVASRTLGKVVAALISAPEEINRAVLLASELQTKIAMGDLTLGELTLKRAEMQEALDAGEAEETRVEQARARLLSAPAQSSCFVPAGF